MKRSLTKKGKKGFTLIELVVVIAILGILAAILIPVIGGFITRANEARDMANARNLYNSVAMVLAVDEDPGTPAAPSDALIDLFGAFPDATNATWDWTIADGIVTSASFQTLTGNGAMQVYTR